MKQIKFIVSSLFILLAAGSCKKENTAAPVVAASAKISKIDKVGSTWSTSYSYNAQGRLSEVKDNSYTAKYDYTNGTPVIAYYITATGSKDITHSEMVLNSSNRVSQYTTRLFDAQGQPSSTYSINFEYDANGFQVKKLYHVYECTTEVTNGNMTKRTIRNTNTGTVDRTFTYEFYTDKTDKLNLNIFEQGFYDDIVNDKNLMGTKNTNLVKKLTYQSATRTEVSNFTYVTNAEGLVTEYTQSKSVNGAASVSTTYKITYQ